MTTGSEAAAARRSWLGPVAATAFVLGPLLFWGGRVLDEEAVGFLRKYWGERGALQKILDVRGWDFYQGRELSYAIDYLDAQWLRLLVSHDVLFFVPPSALAASLAFVATGAWLAPRALPRLDAATRWLTLLLLASSFTFVSTMGLLYRATKPVVGPLLLALLLLAVAEHRAPRLGRAAAFWAAFLVALAMSLLDRQGLFYVLALILVLSAAWLRTRRGAPLLLGSLAAVVVWYLYFAVAGPSLIHAVEGYWPSTRFQRLRPSRLLDVRLWTEAAGILGDWTSALLGRLPPLLLALATLAAGVAWGWRERARPLRLGAGAAIAAAAIAAQLAMVAMMLERHPPVSWISHRLWYYPLPYQVLVVFGLLCGLDALARSRRGGLPRAVPLVLAGLVVLNVARWPELRQQMAADAPVADELRRSALLVQSLRQGHAALLLDGDYRRLYYECLDLFPRFAARARPQVGEAGGVLVSEIVDGRVVAWAEQHAQLAPRAPVAGPYVLAGRVRLRPGDRLQLLLGSRLVDTLSAAPDGSPVPFRLRLELPAGVNNLQLLSQLPERRVPDPSVRRYAGFQLELPVLLWPDATR